MRAGRRPAPVPLPEAAARVPGRKSPRRSAERASRLQRDGPRFAHAVVAPRTRDITEKSAPVGAPPPPRSGGWMRTERTNPDARTRRGNEETYACERTRLRCVTSRDGQHRLIPREARRAVAKDGRPRIDLRALMLRDASLRDAPQHEEREFAWLFDIVNGTTANGSLRAPRLRTLVSRASERQASEDPGPRSYTAKSMDS